MSFILDALRKSEHARQQERGPALAEIPVAVARPRTNIWATAAVVLLLVNLVGVGVLLLRRASHESPAAGAPATAGTTSAVVTPPGIPAPAAAAPAPAPQASLTRTLPETQAQPTLRAPEPAPAVPYPTTRNPLEREVSGGDQPGLDEGMAAQAASVPEGAPAVRRTTADVPRTKRGSVVYETVPEATADVPAEAAPEAQPAPSSLPTADDMKGRAGLPDLHLDLHVYSTKAQERFIFVNSHRYREGDTMQEGPVVEQITPKGAVLNFRGNRFLLTSN